MFKRKIGIALTMVSVGCVSQIPSFKEYVEPLVGQPVAKLIEVKQDKHSYASRTGWQEKTYKLDNGNSVYVSPEREGCIVHWEVNSSGIIVGYRTEGGRCY